METVLHLVEEVLEVVKLFLQGVLQLILISFEGLNSLVHLFDTDFDLGLVIALWIVLEGLDFTADLLLTGPVPHLCEHVFLLATEPGGFFGLIGVGSHVQEVVAVAVEVVLAKGAVGLG